MLHRSNNVEFLAKHWGDLAGALGLAFTIWLAFQAKTAAEQARDAAHQVRERISALDTIGDLSTAITILQEIMRLQRTNAWNTVWEIVLDRYATVRVHLVRSEQGTGVNKTHQRSIRTALDQFGIISGRDRECSNELGARGIGYCEVQSRSFRSNRYA